MTSKDKTDSFLFRSIRKIKRLPDLGVGYITRYLHEKFYTSPELKKPSNIKLDGISNFLARVGVQKGEVVFVHSAWENLNSGNFNAVELIKLLLEAVGEEGTVAMPAIPNVLHVSGAKFDVRRTPSAAGILTEVFRRYPGVKRSINLNHSVCALGPDADFLTSDHHRSETSWDRYSPYYRLREIENSWIIGLGVGHRLKVATALHCVESALREENDFFGNIFREEICYEYKTTTGEVGCHCYRERTGQIYTPKLAKYFSSDELIEETIDGLEVYAIRARTLIDKSIMLGRKGKTMYVWPVPFSWYFKK